MPTKRAEYGDRAVARLARAPGAEATDAHSSPARSGFSLIICVYSLSHIESQRDYDVPVVYGAMDGPGGPSDLKKDVVVICV